MVAKLPNMPANHEQIENMSESIVTGPQQFGNMTNAST